MTTPPASSDQPTLAENLDGVTRIKIVRVQAVPPPFDFAKDEVMVSDPADVEALIRAIGPDRPATAGGPRCLTAFSAELFTADGSSKGFLNLYCAAGTDEPMPIIRDRDPSRSWRFADPDAARALLERLGN